MTNRRTFVGSSAAAIVYRLAPAAPLQKAFAANDQIGLGFIGSGIRGSQLLDDFKGLPGARPVAVCDLYDGCLERAREQTDGTVEITKEYEKILARRDVDAVVIATPDHWHRAMVLDALKAGKHVYIEKPISLNIDEGREMAAASATRPAQVVQVGSQGKTSTLTAKTRELVKSGALGKVSMVRMSEHRNNAQGAWVYPVPPDASEKTIDWRRFLGTTPQRSFDPRIFFRWRCWWEYSGGVATDLFVHQLTWLHEAMDAVAPRSAVSQGGIYRWNDGRTVPDVMNSILEYDGFIVDLYVNLASGGTSSGGRGLTIMGTEATLVQEGSRITLYPERTLPDVQSYGTLNWPKALRAAYFDSHGYTEDGRPKSPLPPARKPEEISVPRGPSHFELFLTSIRESKPSRETAEEGHYAAAAAHLANLAYRNGRRMSWDRATGKVKDS